MPKKTISKDNPNVDSFTEEPRGKRARQQDGFYATLLKGRDVRSAKQKNKKAQKQQSPADTTGAEPTSRRCFIKDLRDATVEQGKNGTESRAGRTISVSDHDRHSREKEGMPLATVCQETSVKSTPATVCQETSVKSTPATVCQEMSVNSTPARVCQETAVKSTLATVCQETAVKSTDVCVTASQGRQKDEVLVKKVVAVIHDSTLPSQRVADFLRGDSFSRQLNEDQVEHDQSADQVTIRGSIEEIQQVLTALAQIKSRSVPDPVVAGEVVEKETVTTTVLTGDGTGRLPCSESSSASEIASTEQTAECIQNDKKTVYIEDSDGINMLVSVDVPSTPHYAAVVADNHSTIATDSALRNQEAEDTVSGDVIYLDSFAEHGTNAYTVNSCQQAETSAAVGLGMLVQTRPSPLVVGNRVSVKTRGSSPFVNIRAGGDSAQTKQSTSFSYERNPKLPPSTELLNRLSVSSAQAEASSSSPQGGRERWIKAKDTQVGDSAHPPLPLSLPGLLPLESSVRCGLCDEVCANAECVKRHMDAMHASHEEVFQCEVCSLVFPDKRTLLAHLKARHEAADLSCQICGRKFQCQRYLRTHLQRHAGVKKFECPQCGWRFFERHKLNFHMELHKAEGERRLPYRCDLCGKQFSNKATWSDHCNTHSGLRPFVCTICGAKFGHRVGLRRHKLTHDKVKAFQCKVCSKTFTVKPKLEEHMITHTGISKHACPGCHKVFTAASSLKRHATKCSADATLRATRNSSADAIQQGQEVSSYQDLDSGSVFLCSSCNTCFSTYHEAEQHALTHHQGVEDSGSVEGMPTSSGISPAGVMVTAGDSHQRELTVNLKELEQLQLAASTLADLSTV